MAVKQWVGPLYLETPLKNIGEMCIAWNPVPSSVVNEPALVLCKNANIK